jgi:hypothetical protein
MNMNLDDPHDHQELNLTIENYVMAEFVAVPPDFDIKSHLTMREQVGLFKVEEIDLNQLEIISSAVANSPVFSTMNNATLNPKSCFFFLQLMTELNLVLKKIDNPIRRAQGDYEWWVKQWTNQDFNYVRGQDVKRMSFLIVNVVPLMSQSIIDEAWTALEELQKYQTEINKSNPKFD